MPGFHCATCGDFHDEMPMVLGAWAPVLWEAIPAGDREERGIINSDQCIIDGKYFFILGRLEIPILDSHSPFTWLTWVSVSRLNFDRANSVWDQPGREKEPPYFVWVQSALPYPVVTLKLQGDLVTRPIGQRPLVVLHEADHLLYREQVDGITTARVQQIVETALHPEV
jgi:hypothetical protein